jgi:hypothetical protein
MTARSPGGLLMRPTGKQLYDLYDLFGVARQA